MLNVINYLVERQNEPTIILASLAIDHTYDSALRLGVNLIPNRYSNLSAILGMQWYTRRYWKYFLFSEAETRHLKLQDGFPHWAVRSSSEEKSFEIFRVL